VCGLRRGIGIGESPWKIDWASGVGESGEHFYGINEMTRLSLGYETPSGSL